MVANVVSPIFRISVSVPVHVLNLGVERALRKPLIARGPEVCCASTTFFCLLPTIGESGLSEGINVTMIKKIVWHRQP